jgi:glucose/arabinose dehydrogenase
MPTAIRSGGGVSTALALAVGLAVGVAACSTSASLSPTGSTVTATPPPPSAASATQPRTPTTGTAAPTEAATRVPLANLRITTEPFSRIDGAALSMAAPNDGTGRIFVGSQDGQVWIVNGDGSVESKPFVDLTGRIRSGGEQGLLGLAVHPAFPTDPRVFVDFTNKEGDTIIASLRIDPGNPDRLDPDSFKQLLFIDQPYANHNGGSIEFGPNGYLTIAMGDGGAGGDPHRNGQNPDALLGKILRIDVDGGSGSKGYGIPPENPSAKDGGAPEVWISGMRNPWRTSFDRSNGDFWIGDVGQAVWEEVDVVRRGTQGPVNFGWNITEGPDCYNAQSCRRDGLTGPVSAYKHDLGCAIVGGYVYRGSAYPFLAGTYLFSDNCTSHVWAIDAASDGPSDPVQVGQVDGNVATFGEGADGELYMLTLQGSVLKVVAQPG